MNTTDLQSPGHIHAAHDTVHSTPPGQEISLANDAPAEQQHHHMRPDATTAPHGIRVCLVSKCVMDDQLIPT